MEQRLGKACSGTNQWVYVGNLTIRMLELRVERRRMDAQVTSRESVEMVEWRVAGAKVAPFRPFIVRVFCGC